MLPAARIISSNPPNTEGWGPLLFPSCGGGSRRSRESCHQAGSGSACPPPCPTPDPAHDSWQNHLGWFCRSRIIRLSSNFSSSTKNQERNVSRILKTSGAAPVLRQHPMPAQMLAEARTHPSLGLYSSRWRGGRGRPPSSLSESFTSHQAHSSSPSPSGTPHAARLTSPPSGRPPGAGARTDTLD